MHILVSIMHIWLFGMAEGLYNLPILPQRFRICNVKVLITIHLFLRTKLGVLKKKQPNKKLGVLPKTTMFPNHGAKTSTPAVK